MVSDGVPGDVQCAMRCVYVREGEFSGSTRGFRLSGSDRLETILECDGDDETRSGSRSFLLQRQRVDGGDESDLGAQPQPPALLASCYRGRSRLVSECDSK